MIKNSSEYLLFGKPTLDELRYASDKLSIELRCLGLRFASVLPHELKDDRPGAFLYASDNDELVATADRSSTKTLKLMVP